MSVERAQADLADLLDGFVVQMRDIARVQRERAELTASASTAGKRVTVTVNADGQVIDVRFANDIDDLGYDEIARAVAAAAREAAADVARKNETLMAPLRERRAGMPKLEDMIEGVPSLREHLPVPPRPSTAPPHLRQAEQPEAPGPAGTLDLTSDDW